VNDRKSQQVPNVFAGFTVDASTSSSWKQLAIGEMFLEGLVEFANTGDSIEDYNALKEKRPPDFWPLWMMSAEGIDLSWTPEAHTLFLFYRNLLRRFWTRDRETVNDVFQIALLFGAVRQRDWKSILDDANCEGVRKSLHDALAPLRTISQEIKFREETYPFAGFWVNWNAGSVDYVPASHFHRAAWLLFRQSWRARACPRCSTYFLAQQPAQFYCSSSCSAAVHRASSLNYWREKGAQRARSRAKQKRKTR
jgi:hypothetical protein